MGFNNQHAVAPYDEFSQQVSYVADDGLLQIPVAGPPGTPCEIVRQHAGVGQRLTAFAAQRTGALPELPTADPQFPGEVLAGTRITPCIPSLMADGTGVVRVEGSYVHFLLQPLTHKNYLPMGAAPFDEATGDQYQLLPTGFTVHGVPAPRAIANPPQSPPPPAPRPPLVLGIVGGR